MFKSILGVITSTHGLTSPGVVDSSNATQAPHIGTLSNNEADYAALLSFWGGPEAIGNENLQQHARYCLRSAKSILGLYDNKTLLATLAVYLQPDRSSRWQVNLLSDEQYAQPKLKANFDAGAPELIKMALKESVRPINLVVLKTKAAERFCQCAADLNNFTIKNKAFQENYIPPAYALIRA